MFKRRHLLVLGAAAIVAGAGLAGLAIWLGDDERRPAAIRLGPRHAGSGSGSEGAAYSASDAFDGHPDGGAAGGSGEEVPDEPVDQSLWAYLWANQSTAASYTPSTAYQRSSKGELNTIVRTGTGDYTVTFRKLGLYGGTVHVTAYGLGSEWCKVRNWYPTPFDLKARVVCFNISGEPADSRFTASFAAPVGGFGWAYVWGDQPAAASYVPSLTFQDNSQGQANEITRSSSGRYRVRLPRVGAPGGAVKVTAYGDRSETCKVDDWHRDGLDELVTVQCNAAVGVATDSRFTMTFHGTNGLLGVLPDPAAERAYLLADQPAAASYSPALSYNSAGGVNTVARTSSGLYTVRLPGLGVPRGHVQVTTYRSADAARCKVSSWGPGGGDESVYIRCFHSSGLPIDAQFVLDFVD